VVLGRWVEPRPPRRRVCSAFRDGARRSTGVNRGLQPGRRSPGLPRSYLIGQARAAYRLALEACRKALYWHASPNRLINRKALGTGAGGGGEGPAGAPVWRRR